MKILIIDDEIENGKIIQKYGEYLGYHVDIITNPHLCINQLHTTAYNIILLDVMMPEINGFELITKIQEITSTKIIFLSALGETQDRIKGLKSGATDYLTKPFSLEELFLKIEIIINNKPEIITVNNIDFDSHNSTIKINNQQIKLSNTLYKLMFELVSNKGITLSREHLLATVWSYNNENYNRTVDTHILKLRNSLGSNSFKIITVVGKGYKYED